MHAYELSPREEAQSSYHKDVKALKAATRLIPSCARLDVRVRLVDVSLAKVDVVAVLNGQKPVATVLKQWRLSTRGRLIEIPADSKE